ncbi:BEN domain-containing protein 5-like [Amblyomma americanum]
MPSVPQDKADLPSAPLEIETAAVSNAAPHLPSQDDMVDIGRGIQISNSAWVRIQQLPKDSMFVKELLLAIWGVAALRNRSLQGRHCPKYPDRPRKTALSPVKLAVMRECYRERLQKNGVPAHMVNVAVKQLNRFVVEKLGNIEKLAMRYL